MPLPADTHVHTEWSWDTGGPESDARGRMVAQCERAVAIGLPAVLFTDHLDLGRWSPHAEDLAPHQAHFLQDGVLRLPRFDFDGRREAIDRCRHAFPGLEILAGLEFGEPHRHWAEAAELFDLDSLDRINGSLHLLAIDDRFAEPITLYRSLPAAEVMRRYLAEFPALVASPEPFAVVTHIDYAVRHWPVDSDGPFDPRAFEDEFRAAMRAIAASGRALEMNTRRLRSWVPQWWSEEGGRAVSFGSDAHAPAALAGEFPEATAMLESFGFRPGRRPFDLWTR